MAYAELAAASAFSFLEGASQPEALAERAAALGYPALALVDADGLYGAVRFYKAATEAGVRPLVGAALTLEDGARLADLEGETGGLVGLTGGGDGPLAADVVGGRREAARSALDRLAGLFGRDR